METPNLTAASFIAALLQHGSGGGLRNDREQLAVSTSEYGQGDVFAGVKMSTVFRLANAYVDLPPQEIELLMDCEVHEVRASAMRIMARQFAKHTTTPAQREALYALYLCRHDRINDWDLVDLAAWRVLGRYLADKPRDILYRLANSAFPWERRSAILATFAFIKVRQYDDTLAIAKMLINDTEELIHKATGGMLRAVGGKDRSQLVGFLNNYAGIMPQTMLHSAVEHFAPAERATYLAR